MLRSEHIDLTLWSFSWAIYSSPLFKNKLDSNTSSLLQKSEWQMLCLGNCDDVSEYK